MEIKERTNKFTQKIYDHSSISLAPEDIENKNTIKNKLKDNKMTG